MLASRKLFRWEVFKGGSEIFKTWADLSRLHFLKMLISTLPKSIIFNYIKSICHPHTMNPNKLLMLCWRRAQVAQRTYGQTFFFENTAGVSYHCDKNKKKSEQWRGETHNPQNEKKKRKKTKSSHVCTRSRSISLSEGEHTLWTPCIHWRGRRTSASLPEHNEYIII